MNDIVLACQGVCRDYKVGPETVRVLRGLDLQVAQGSLVSIVGTSGSGKTTLLNILAGLDTPTAGEVIIAGHALSAISDRQRGVIRNKDMGFVFQFHHLLPEFTALENLLLPSMIGKTYGPDVKEYAASLLERVGLGDRLHHKPSELSGGERQRVAIARALVNRPKLVLMDEPTGNLDEDNSKQIEALIVDLNHNFKISFVVVTHSRDLADAMAERYQLVDGKLQSGAVTY
jgi:lipoprotein-releasing system ATP-binding protein